MGERGRYGDEGMRREGETDLDHEEGERLGLRRILGKLRHDGCHFRQNRHTLYKEDERGGQFGGTKGVRKLTVRLPHRPSALA